MHIVQYFITGFVSVMKIMGGPLLYRYPYRTSAEALRSDWNHIGKDVEAVMGKLAKERAVADDREERPYRTGGYQQQQGNRDRMQNRTVEILPHPEILESYNYVVEGSAKTIITMFELEQKHRHEWETQALRTHSFSTTLGQFLGFFIAVAVFVSATLIGMYGNTTIAAFIWIFGMAIVVMAGLVWSYAKSMGQRPLFARPTMRSHFRPQKERDGTPEE